MDLYRKCVLSQSGKDAGNKSMSKYLGEAEDNYGKYLSKMRAQRERAETNKTEEFELY